MIRQRNQITDIDHNNRLNSYALKIQGGDKSAEEELLVAEDNYISGIAGKKYKSRIDFYNYHDIRFCDIKSAVQLGFINGVKEWDHIHSIKTWLFITIKREIGLLYGDLIGVPAQKRNGKTVSLHNQDEDEYQLIDTIVSGEATSSEIVSEEESIKNKLEFLFRNTNQNDHKALYLRFGLNLSYEETGFELGVSKERIHQRIYKAKETLRIKYGNSEISDDFKKIAEIIRKLYESAHPKIGVNFSDLLQQLDSLSFEEKQLLYFRNGLGMDNIETSERLGVNLESAAHTSITLDNRLINIKSSLGLSQDYTINPSQIREYAWCRNISPNKKNENLEEIIYENEPIQDIAIFYMRDELGLTFEDIAIRLKSKPNDAINDYTRFIKRSKSRSKRICYTYDKSKLRKYAKERLKKDSEYTKLAKEERKPVKTSLLLAIA